MFTFTDILTLSRNIYFNLFSDRCDQQTDCNNYENNNNNHKNNLYLVYYLMHMCKLLWTYVRMYV